jgi:hypothetical protein
VRARATRVRLRCARTAVGAGAQPALLRGAWRRCVVGTADGTTSSSYGVWRMTRCPSSCPADTRRAGAPAAPELRLSGLTCCAAYKSLLSSANEHLAEELLTAAAAANTESSGPRGSGGAASGQSCERVDGARPHTHALQGVPAPGALGVGAAPARAA